MIQSHRRFRIQIILSYRHLGDVSSIYALSDNFSSFLECIVDIGYKNLLVMFESQVKNVRIQVARFEVFQSSKKVKQLPLTFSLNQLFSNLGSPLPFLALDCQDLALVFQAT